MAEATFQDYWARLQELAEQYGEYVADRDAWSGPFDEGRSAEQAFFDEYPEHKND